MEMNKLGTCAVVAGTNGRQTRRKAGVTKGRQMRLSAIAEPPGANVMIFGKYGEKRF
jgi:hypothetical protein